MNLPDYSEIRELAHIFRDELRGLTRDEQEQWLIEMIHSMHYGYSDDYTPPSDLIDLTLQKINFSEH